MRRVRFEDFATVAEVCFNKKFFGTVLLIVAGIEHGAAAFAQVIDEGPFPVYGASQSEQIHAVAHEIFHAEVILPGGGQADA